VIAKTTTGPLDFETVEKKKGGHKHDSEDSDEFEEAVGKVPVYLGITLHEDPAMKSKLAKIFHNLEDVLHEHRSSVLEANIKALQEIWLSGKKESGGWRKPEDFHVTCLYLGKAEDKMEHKIYQNFENGVAIPVTIHAFVLVPNKIVTGICFPEHPVENRCPHVTLLVNEWQPVMSNNVLEAACTRGASSPFAGVYDELRQGRKLAEDKEILTGQIKLQRDSVTNSCYFVALEAPITFTGVTKTYY
jgi:hypothetical protein